jgi:hypothetical protein
MSLKGYGEIIAAAARSQTISHKGTLPFAKERETFTR